MPPFNARLTVDTAALVANWRRFAGPAAPPIAAPRSRPMAMALAPAPVPKRLVAGRLPRSVCCALARSRGAVGRATRASRCFTASAAPTWRPRSASPAVPVLGHRRAGRSVEADWPPVRRDGRYRAQPARPVAGRSAVGPAGWAGARYAAFAISPAPKCPATRATNCSARALPIWRRASRRGAMRSPIRAVSGSAPTIISG